MKSSRHLSRSFAVQGIYHDKLNKAAITEIEKFLSINEHYNKANYELMHEIIEKAITDFDKYLEYYIPFLNRNITEINLVEQIILVIAALELKTSLNIPAPIIINEAIELSKTYGGQDAHKFINGLVDKLAKELRDAN